MTVDAMALLGAALAPTTLREMVVGPWRFGYAAGGLRYLRAGGSEALRAVDFVARDAAWGAPAPTLEGETVEAADGRLRIAYAARIGTALKWRAEVVAQGERLSFVVEVAAAEDFDTARTGFVTLHPLAGFAGEDVTATSPSGAETRVTIPELVSPAQPLRDIARLTVPAAGGTVEIAFDADQPFEMEDQRNWTDASFKTYYRPLSLPWPYRLRAGETFRQAIRLTFRAGAGPAAQANAGHAGVALAAPAIVGAAPAPLRLGPPVAAPRRTLVALPGAQADDAATLAALRPDRLDAQIDLRTADMAVRAGAARALAAALGCPLGLRLILDDAADPAPALAVVAAAAGPVATALALPAAWLDSHQPEGPWPAGLSCVQALAAARAAFPGAEAQEGMLTFFPEFNRHPPRAGGDAVSFGTAAIVHAADDISAMETLEALPSVLATAAAHAAGRPVEVGLASLGLWRNPYGGRLIPNPGWGRVAMTDRDPRIRGLFGAAWLTGWLAHAAAAGVRAVGVGAVAGPLGVAPGPQDDAAWAAAYPDARVRPLALVVAALAGLGPMLRVCAPSRRGDLVALVADGRALLANTAAEPQSVAGLRISAARVLDEAAMPAALADPGWLDGPPAPVAGTLTLPPYAVAIVHLEDA